MIKACVIGWPISHSRSPMIHGYWLKQHRIDGAYTRQPVQPEHLATFIRDLRTQGYAGCNVTLPHKETVFQLVTPADDTVRRLQAVNTVYRNDGRWHGTNTDGEGFINSLAAGAPGLALRGNRAVLLGAGGASVAIINALIENGVREIAVANRSREKAEALADRFGRVVRPYGWGSRNDLLGEASLLVNTTSLGMSGQPPLELDLARLDPNAVVTDIVYTPLRTALLNGAAARGNRIVEGLGMLLHQAVRGFHLWFGVRPDVTDELYRLIATDIDPDHGR
jgi:shikimate dehydrogenase